MRRAIACAVVLVLIVGGCWLAGERAAVRSPSLADDLAMREIGGIDPTAVSGAPELEPPLEVADGEHFEVFDLLENRPLSHRLRGPQGRTTAIRGGHFDFVRYIQGNHRRDWLIDVEISDADGAPTRAAAVRGRSARMTMPAVKGGDADALWARVYNPVSWDNELGVEINGQAVGSVDLEAGWQVVELDLDVVATSADNDVELEFSNLGHVGGVRSGGGVDWIAIGPALEADELPEGADSTGPDAPAGSDAAVTGQQAVSLDRGRGLSWTAWIHGDALLELDIEADPTCGPSVRVATEAEEGEVDYVERTDIELVRGRGDVQTVTVDPGVDSEQVGRIDLWNPGEEDCGEIGLETARLVRPGTNEGVPDDFEPPQYVAVWVVDTLRADHLPIHFDTEVEAPNFVDLADGGVSFANAYVQGTESRASHASLFTAKYPDNHGVMAGGTVHPHLPILSHSFRDAGYRTAMFAANGYVSHLLNLNRGWDTYRNFIHEETALDAEFIAEHGIEWIEARDDEPFFMYLGTIDPHATYRRHDDCIEHYESGDYRGRFRNQLTGDQLGEIKIGAIQPTEREREWISNLYRNEITYNDRAFGEFRDALEEQGIWEDTLVVMTSDHGEEFWEHGSVGHGHSVYQEMVHVPLIFHYPRGLPAGRTIRSGGEVVDVLPTLRDMLDLAPLEDRQGESLLPVIFGEHGGYPRPALATQYGHEYGIQIRDWKLYLRSGSMRLFDRSTDSAETSDVRGEHPLVSRWLQDAIGYYRAHRESWDKSRWGVANNVSGDFIEYVDGQ